MTDSRSADQQTLDQITLIRPDDLHLHVREGDALKAVVNDTAQQFARAVIMPNLSTPVTRVDQAQAYRQAILDVLDKGQDFQPLMTLYLTDDTPPETIQAAKQSGIIQALKLYPAGATTNSSAGVTTIEKIYPTLEAMEKLELPLLVHGEVTDPAIDIFDRERVFIDSVLRPLQQRFPSLKVVMEHITTRDAVDYVRNATEPTAATITAHHLLMNRNALFTGGVRPHHYCLPVLKREEHRQALLDAAVSGDPRFFLGTDSAPHAQQAKESACGCAGIYTAFHAMQLYAEAFDQRNALDRLEGFASIYGARFYGLAQNSGSISLKRQTWQVPDSLPFSNQRVIPLRAGEQCLWTLMKK